MRRFLLVLVLPFLASLVFGWDAFPIVCGLYLLSLLLVAFLRLFGVKLIPDEDLALGAPPLGNGNICSVNPSTGLPMVGGVDTGGNAYGCGRRNH
jgi:hypothetical protein